MVIEPMHRSLENNLDAAQHTICKYVERYKVKGGVRDLEAARDLLIDYIDYVKYGTWKGKSIQQHPDIKVDAPGCHRGVHVFKTLEDGDSQCIHCRVYLSRIPPNPLSV